MIKLAVFDIDGTLFDEKKKEFPLSAVTALQQLHRNGVAVAAATGRPPRTAELMRDVGIPLDYLVCCNGHLVLDGEGNAIEDRRFSSGLAEEVWQFCRSHDVGLLWKYPECTYVYRNDPEFDKIFAKSRKGPTVYYDDVTIHWTREPNGGCLACDTAALADFNRAFAGQCLGVDINGRSSDLLLWGVTKQTGLAVLLEKIGIRSGECIAFGDNRNDMEVLRFAGVGVAMGNSEEELKAVSDYVTTDVDADGILLALRHFELID